MHTNFQIIKDFIETSNSTNSNTDKINILKEYAEHTVVKKVLFYKELEKIILRIGIVRNIRLENLETVSGRD